MASAASVTAALLGVPACERAVVQVCFSVRSIERSAGAWASGAGAGPFFRVGDSPMELTNVSHRDGAAGWIHSTSLGQCGRVMIELLEHHSAWPESLVDELGVGAYGLHHVAWLVDDLDAESARLDGLGMRQIMSAMAGPQEFRFHDATDGLGCRIEIYLGQPPVPAVFGAVARAARGWNGEHCLRSIDELVLDEPVPEPS
jgi:methylmalonyl-CoA/ethylmalonyl-CoA epimerase